MAKKLTQGHRAHKDKSKQPHPKLFAFHSLSYSFPLWHALAAPPCTTPYPKTRWTGFCQAPLSMAFSRQRYWSGLPFSSPGDLPDPGIKPWSPSFQADSLPPEPPGIPSNIKILENTILEESIALTLNC